MGMAASQARYLTLTARKTNTEYEGQQINQARVALANQSADLFNQMLSMEVPKCPDSTDFTTIQYSWSDGINTSVLSDFYQLGCAEEEYNYIVKSYHYENVYTGTRKLLHDPQIQSSMDLKYHYYPDDKDLNKEFRVQNIVYDVVHDKYMLENAENETTKTFTRVDDFGETRLELDAIYGRTEEHSANLFYYDEDNDTYVLDTGKIDQSVYDGLTLVDKDDATQLQALQDALGANYDDTKDYYLREEDGTYVMADDIPQNPLIYEFTKVDQEDSEQLQKLKETYGLEYNENENYYFDENAKMYVKESDILKHQNNMGMASDIFIRKQDDGTVYYTDGEYFITAQDIARLSQVLNEPVPDNNLLVLKRGLEDRKFFNFEAVGNCTLEELSEKDFEDKDIKTELLQIMKDMRGENGNAISAANFEKCFDETGQYLGGIYTFKMNGIVYYTTEDDLETSAQSAYAENSLADNNIDMQTTKMPYYKANYLKTKIEETLRALLETDGSGRFASVRFEDDSVVYTLNTETITDEAAYANAMNQYYYNQEQYSKAIADINAKTEIIQAQDRTLELRLKQLDTEQNALQTEMEAVKKVVSKNVETSFKTFGGG